MSTLLDAGKLGDIDVRNRVFMAPLTRNRAHADGTPNEIAIKYYAQRAGAGLIITEGAQISPRGQGYVNTPGIFTAQQIDAWKKITDAVHAEGGKIVVQLWHVGRISHTSLQPGGASPLAPSAIQAKADTFTDRGVENASEPKALSLAEIESIKEEYVRSAKLAIEAGFDGVEVHGANGYLLNQFIAKATNARDDAYGGSVENRARLLLETVDAVSDEIGRGRVGVRLSPTGTFNDIKDDDAEENYSYLFSEIAKRDVAYLHVVERFPGYAVTPEEVELFKSLRGKFTGNYIGNGDYDRSSATQAVKDGAFGISFGRFFISNPDLPERFRLNAPLAEPDPETFYGGDEAGYSDYPTLAETLETV